jgi:hypothetical protein
MAKKHRERKPESPKDKNKKRQEKKTKRGPHWVVHASCRWFNSTGPHRVGLCLRLVGTDERRRDKTRSVIKKKIEATKKDGRRQDEKTTDAITTDSRRENQCGEEEK